MHARAHAKPCMQAPAHANAGRSHCTVLQLKHGEGVYCCTAARPVMLIVLSCCVCCVANAVEGGACPECCRCATLMVNGYATKMPAAQLAPDAIVAAAASSASAPAASGPTPEEVAAAPVPDLELADTSELDGGHTAATSGSHKACCVSRRCLEHCLTRDQR